MNDDLAALFPGEVVEVAGESIKVHPFYFGQLSRVVKFCRPIIEALMSSGIMTIAKNTDNTSTITIDKDFLPKIVQIMDDGGEPFMGLVAYAVDKPRDWLDKVPIDEGMHLSEVVWQVNSDFFVKKVLPILAKQLSGSISIGGTSSPGSLNTGTDASISTVTP